MLESDSAAERWAAVRAMAQIGGAGAAPAVQFMIPRLAAAPEVDAYHMLIYLALLGPVAKDALPVVERTRFRMNGAVQQATLWAIEPDKRFPWLPAAPSACQWATPISLSGSTNRTSRNWATASSPRRRRWRRRSWTAAPAMYLRGDTRSWRGSRRSRSLC